MTTLKFATKLAQHLAVFTLLGVAGASHAHDRWIVPSDTVISDEKAAVVSFDVSISNFIFHPDRSLGGNKTDVVKHKSVSSNAPTLVALNSDANTHTSPLYNFGNKSTGAIAFNHDGTTRVAANMGDILFTLFKNSKGERRRVFGGKDHPDIPADASDKRTIKMFTNMHTYVSRNGQTTAPVSNTGIELASGQHPNDLFAGEAVQLGFLFNGKPLPANTEVVITPGATRYRNDRGSVTLTSNAQGQIEHTFTQSGLYLVNIAHGIKSTEKDVDQARYNLFLTLEVMPE